MGALKQIAFRIFGTLFLTLVLIWGGGFFRVSFGQVAPSTAQVMSVSLYMLDAENNEVPNGEYEVRFALYTNDRLESDGYPSNADANTRVWEETQTVSVYNGIVSAFLGSVVPFPENLTFDEGEYYLGIRINQDAEIAPRKKLGSVPTAINSQFLRGKTIGTDEGDLVVLEKGGKLNQDFIPEITALGTVSQGVWEGEVIESDYIVKALTDKTYNGLILAKSGSGFSIEGGSSVLEVQADVALNQNLLTSSAPQFVGIGLSSAAAPIAPDAGDIYSDGSDLYFYNGTTWEDLTLASAGGNVSGSGVAGYALRDI